MSKISAIQKATNRGRERLVAINAAIGAVEGASHAPELAGTPEHGRFYAANASLLSEGYFSEPLTTYAVGISDMADLQAEVEFFCPQVQVPRRFDYREFTHKEHFYSDVDEDLRAIGADFKQVTYTATEETGKTVNRGLTVPVDLDQVADLDAWRESTTRKLIERLLRNKLRRAVALLAAAANNTAKTWDTTAGKDPDQDVISELITAANLLGMKHNRIAYGDTAWSKRGLSHRAQTSAGGFASAGLTAEQVAGLLGVEQVLVSKSRYSSGSTTLAETVSNLVLMFTGLSSPDPMGDPSNIKGFWSPCAGGERIRIYEQQVNAKLWLITAEHYELTKVTSTLGIRKFTVS